jgi:phage shock protein PspC (stress-responsive transcriptional regulator)
MSRRKSRGKNKTVWQAIQNLVARWSQQMRRRKLRRVTDEEWIAGVCAGVAYKLGIPVWTVRLAWVLCSIFYGVGLLPYLLLWIFLPEWVNTPGDFNRVTGD